MVNKSTCMKMLICGSLLCGSPLGYAAEVEQEYSLEETVITATRTMKQLQEVSSSVSVVTGEELAHRNVTSVQEKLQFLPGVYMSPVAQGSVQMRGFCDNKDLFLVDSQQMNATYDGTANLNAIPVENIAKIEVFCCATSSDGHTSVALSSNYNKMDWEGAGKSSQHPGKLYNYALEKAWENLGDHTLVAGASFKQEEMQQKRYYLSSWRNEDSITGQYA